MTAGLQIATDVCVVVNLAVEDDPDRAVLVRERLLPRLQIDDAQAAMREGGSRVEAQAGFVGTAGVEPESENGPAKDPTGLVRPGFRTSVEAGRNPEALVRLISPSPSDRGFMASPH